TRPSAGVYRLTRHIEFDYDEANGVLTEWGFSSSSSAGSNLFNRALFTDGGGTPEAVTKTDQEKLRLTYTLEVTLSPVSLTAGSFDLTGVGTVNGDYTLIGGSAPSSITQRCKAPDLLLFSTLARGDLNTVGGASQSMSSGLPYAHDSSLSGVTYTDSVTRRGDSSERTAPRQVL